MKNNVEMGKEIPFFYRISFLSLNKPKSSLSIKFLVYLTYTTVVLVLLVIVSLSTYSLESNY